MKRTVLLAAFACAAFGQSRVSGPSLGYVFDAEAASARPVLGIAGSALVGAPLDIAGRKWKALSARNETAIGVDAVTGDVFFIDLATQKVSPIAGVQPSPDRIILSPTGSAALLIRDGEFDVLHNLNEVSWRARTQGQALAVADDGATVLVSREATAALVTNEGESGFATPGELVAAAFFPDSTDTVLATLSGVYLAKRNESPALLTDAVKTSVVAARGGKVAIASAESRSVSVLDLATRSLSTSTCASSPTVLDPAGSLSFRLTNRLDEPIWLLDISTETPRLTFVPQPGPVNE